jgi:hypothetical protein
MTQTMLVVAIASIVFQTPLFRGTSKAPLFKATPVEFSDLSLEASVTRELGAEPEDCGRFSNMGPVLSVDEVRKGVACVTQHAASGTPAWTGVYRNGFDDWMAEGLLADRTGKVQYYTYVDDGYSYREPKFTVTACTTPAVDKNDRGEIRITCDARRQ